jgi:hypothetical protein
MQHGKWSKDPFGGDDIRVGLRLETCPQNANIEVLTSVSQNVTIGNKVIEDTIRLMNSHCSKVGP